ncbi:hypothetical protein DRH27_03165, partial [Candidatus Falkowbacteria bacterium]
YRFTYLIIFAIFALGIYSLATLPREANPEVKIPFAVVTTVFPGATPTDMEELVTDKIEDKIKNLDNLRRYTSGSGQGVSSIFVEFEAEANLAESIQKLRDAVDTASPKLPNEAENPVVTEISATDIPIVTYSIVGDFTDPELKKFSDILEREFEQIPNVSKIVKSGELEREFQIIASQTKLANFGISLGQVVSAINRTNFSLPSGSIEVDGFNYNVRVEGRFQTIENLSDIVITTYNDTPIYLRDIALIKDSFKERRTESRIGFPGRDPRPTISLQIYKKTGGNILDIVDNSQMYIDTLFENGTLPQNLSIIKTNDNSTFIREDLSRLGTSGIQTMILIVIILMAVLSLRGALITGLAVPFAFLMAFIFLKIEGMTLNSLVLFSLVLSLGLMVDNAIIINEGVDEYISKYKKKPLEAAMLSVWNYKWAITAGTMTTVAAFLPMLLVSGILGEYLATLPMTISATLISSLFVAIIIIPTLVSRFIKIKPRDNGTYTHRDKKRHQFVRAIRKNLQEKYKAVLRNILPHKKKRRLAIASVWILFFLAIAVPITGLMKIEMFSDVDVDYFIINLTLPVGTALENTKLKAEEVEKIVAEIPELDNYVVNIGQSMSADFFSGSGAGASHKASIIANLVPKKERDRKSYEISEDIRPELDSVQGIDATLESISAGPPTGAPIEVRVTGDDTKILVGITKNIEDYFKNINGVINIKNNISNAAGDFTFRIDKQKANYYGLDMISVASTLRNAIFGTSASVVNLGGEDVDITVKYNEDEFTTVNDLENLLITTPRGEFIPLKQIAEVKLEPSLLSINHRDGDNVIIVTADIETGAILQDILNDFDAWKKSQNLPESYNIEVGGEVEDIEKSFQETFLSMIVAIILITFILVLQFNSFRQPFIILFTLPLAIIGVIFGLNLLGQPFSFPAFIGIVALTGIVVNDAIVLIDRINKNLNVGMEYFEGIIEGGVARMQPIFLTSITTIAGIFPLLFADELWFGLSITVIFGLIFSTVLTLIIIPIYYAGMCYKEKCDQK